ncbi:Lcl C-terminal domain-containing protein [Vibrio owensii]|uniref:Lcl C-terminal domain-containing protein n=1 Tax=Vibrio owensii TaxID=696485 RepID=UPI0040690D75
MNKAALICLISIVCGPVYSQVCLTESMKKSYSALDFVAQSDGSIIDARTSLLWQRCPVGMQYENSDCIGYPKVFNTWEEALMYANEYSISVGLTYRLPNIMELDSIVERSCYSPSIDTEIFPSTPSGWFWTNTYDEQVNPSASNPIRSSGTYGVASGARMINFTDGLEFDDGTNKFRYLRLVRDLEK